MEVFNALYVSNALQSASSWTSTVTIMAVDLGHFWLSGYFKRRESALEKIIPPNHPAAKENFTEVALKMIAMKHEEGTRPNEKGGCTDTPNETPVDMLTSSWNEKA